MKTSITTSKEAKFLIKKCHVCGQVHESTSELKKCVKCNQSFLPLNYFGKVHAHKEEEFMGLFAECHELEEEDLIQGLYVIW